MLSIDEAIERERELSERNLIMLDSDELVQKSYDTYLRAKYHEQIVMWLEELKVLKENSISKEAFEKMKSKSHRHGYRQGYAKAIDDFANWLVEQGILGNRCISDGEITDYGKVYAKKYKEQLKEEDKWISKK